MERPDFWTDNESAQAQVRRLKTLKAVIEPINRLEGRLEDLSVLRELADEEDSDETLAEAAEVSDSRDKQGRVKIRHGSVSELPFPDDTFDLATAFETTMFWPSLADDLREVRRVLKPGGVLLIANEAYADARFEERNAKWSRLANFQLQTPEETRQCLVEAGYTQVEIATVPDRNWIAATAQK